MDLPIRGLKAGFESPLQEFTGILDSVDQREETFGGKGKPKLKATFNFKNIKVIKSTEPYNFPIANISLFFSETQKSGWGIFADSITKLIPETEGLGFLNGKLIHMALTGGHDFGTDKVTKEKIIRDCWEVIEIEGVATKVDPTQRVLDILDGKTDVQFNQVALGDPILKTAPSIMDQLVGQTLLPALEQSGKITKDANGIWHKVK